MDASKTSLSSGYFPSRHDISQLLSSALSHPDILSDLDKSYQNRTSGRWSKEEHHRFIEGLTKYGKNWKKVEEHIGTRSGAQIRSHAQKFFIRLTKEFKKRMEREEGDGFRLGGNRDSGQEDKKKEVPPGTRQRSNSVISNFSNFSLDNISENEEEEKGKETKVETPLIERKTNSLNSAETVQQSPTELHPLPKNPGLERFLSNVSEKHEDVKNKLMKSQENNDVLKIPTYEKQLNHYQGIIQFFQGLHSYYESGIQAQNQEKIEVKDIKQNQSFFDFILKNLEKYVNKNDHQSSPIRIRKLSDLVIMPATSFPEDSRSPFLPSKESPMKIPENPGRMRKNSFNLCIENETESRKLENLKRKTILKDVIEKKQKI